MKRALFAVALLLSTSAFAADVQHEAAVTVSVAQQIRGDHNGDYSDLSSPSTVVSLAWGDLIAFSGSQYPDVASSKSFGLHIDGVPRDECVPYVAAVASSFSDVWIASASPTAIGSSVYVHGHLDRHLLEKACHADAVLGMDLITH
jgi:hypothetical protein